MILYTATALASPEPTTYTIPQGMGGVAFQNITSWSWQVTDAHGGDFTILPFSNATIPGSSGETFYVTPLAQTEALTINVPIQVSIAYLKTAPASFSQTSQLPAYAMQAVVTVDTSGGPIDIEGNVTVKSGTIDVATMPVTTVEFNEAQDVNLSASDITLDTQVANVVLSENPGYEVVTNQQWALEFAAAGDTMNQNITMPGGVSLFDMIYVSVFSPSGYLDDYTVSFVPFWFMGQPDTLFYSSIDGVVLPGQGSNTGVYALDLSSVVASGVPFNGISLTVTSSAAVSETVVFSIFGRYASADIRNPSTSPVNAVAPPNDMQDASGSIAEGGTAQTVLESNANRRFLSIVNPGNANGDTLWVNFGSDASAGAGSYPLGPGIGLFFPQGQFVPSSSVSLYAATTGDTFTVKYA